jgi:serine/threonine protein kinase/Flp pilus assembly protein TadD
MIFCPSDERLAQLLEEQLDRRELVDIERHLERCDHCQETLEELTRERFSFDGVDPNAQPEPAARDRSSRKSAARFSQLGHSPTQTSPFGSEPPADVIPEVEGYEILERIGQGGMGVVYRARQGGLERLVALKVIRGGSHAAPEHLARFRIEARALARLGHPNVVQIYDVGRSAGVPFVALELLEGGSLEGRVAGTPQPETTSAELLITLARAMGAAHKAGVVHRDLKSANVLFAADGTPKIADFGLAKRLDEEDGQTQTGQVMGSPSFMAPEQARGREVGPLADVYSLGAILYEMLTGRPPFKGSSPMETLFQVVHDEPVPPTRLRPGLSSDLETIALKCLAKEPDRRYESAEALADDLDRYLSATPILARPIGLRERAWKWARRQPVLATLALVTLLAAIGLASLSYRNYRVALLRTRAEIQNAEEFEIKGLKVIDDGQLDLRDHHYVVGLQRLNDFRLKIPPNPRLADLRDRIDGLITLLRESQRREARIAEAKAQLSKFRSFRRQAQLGAVQSVGMGETRDVKGIRQVIPEALEVFGIGDSKANPNTLLLPEALTAEEKTEVEKGIYELLLMLADAVARPLPGEDSIRQADQALLILDRAYGLRPSPRAYQAYYLIRADCLARKGEKTAAENDRQTASAMPADAFSHLHRGETLHQERKWREAISEFETALRLEPDMFRAQLLLAVCQLQDRLFDQARTNLTACIQREPESINLYLLRGFASGEVGDQRQTDALKVGSRREPRQKEEFQKAIDADFEAAEADFEKVMTLKPSTDERYGLLVNRGVLRFRRHRLDDAVKDLLEAIALRPDEVSAHQVLGEVYRQQGRTEQAIAQFTRGIALKPGMASLYRGRALSRLHRGYSSTEAREESIRDLSEAIRLDRPDDREFAVDRARRARLLLQAGRATDSLADSEDALKAAPNDPEALLLRARSLLELKRFPDVVNACNEAIARGRPSAELYEIRGLGRASRSDYAGAIQDYTQSLALDPNRTTPLIQRGWAYLVSDASSLAFHDFDEAIRLAPGDPDAYNGRGFARVLHGQFREATEDAEASIVRGSTDPRTHYNAARIYAKAAVAAIADNPRKSQKRIAEDYQDRAQALIRLALELMPAADRGEFWRTVVEADPALTALRQRPKFSQLAGQFGRLAK